MVLERPKKYKEKISVYSGKRRKVVYEDVPSVIKAESLLENVDEPQEPIATTSCVPDNTNSTCTTSQKYYLNQMEEYSLLLEKFYIMGSQRSIDLQNKEQKVHDESLRKLEKKLKIKRLSEDSPSFQDNLSSAKEKKRIKQLDCIKQYIDERAHLLELMKKYAKGQAVATRIGRQLKKVAKKLNNEVHKYNEVEVKKIDLDDIKEGKSEVWNIYTQISPAPETYPPVSVKQQCIDLLSTKLRCEEEVNLVKEEMASCIAWLLNDYTHLISKFNWWTEICCDKGGTTNRK